MSDLDFDYRKKKRTDSMIKCLTPDCTVHKVTPHKTGYCSQCRTSKCKECKKIFLWTELGQRICKKCETSRQYFAKAYAGIQ